MPLALPHPRRALLMAWLVATAGMLGSLFLCEGRGWTPCFLCWYQRICLWPLSIILGLAWLRQSRSVVSYVLPQAVLGLALAAYQVVIQELVGEDFLGVCRGGPDCALKVDIGLGPVSIPMLSCTAFAIVVAALMRARQGGNRAEETSRSGP